MLGKNITNSHSPKGLSKITNQLKQLLCCLWLSLCSAWAFADNINISLQDFYSQAPFSDQKVYAYKVDSSGGYTYYASAVTDENGIASLNFDTESTDQYILKTKALGAIASVSDIISGRDNYVFRIGAVKVQLVNGNDPNTPALVNHKVHVQVEKELDKFAYYATGYSDENGRLRIDLPDISSNKRYRFYAQAPVTGAKSYSEPINANGDYKYVVGNLPLRVTLTDSATQQVLGDTRVDVYRVENNTAKWHARVTTNANGQALLDLAPVAHSGDGYFAKVKAFNTYFKSQPLPLHGEFTFELGTTRLFVKDGTNKSQPALAGKDVTFYRLDESGKKHWFGKVFSDDAGLVRVNLPDLNHGAQYIAKAKSEIANIYYELPLTKAGEHEFVVGSIPLNVTLLDASSQSPLKNAEVKVFRLNEDGKRVYVTRANTDDNGQVLFDLAGLHQGEQFQLLAKIYNNAYSYSEVISNAEPYTFAVGKEVLTLRDGSQQGAPPLAATAVTIYKVIGDKKQWMARITTDELGVIRTDLPNIGGDTPYLFSIKSQLNGKTKYSEPLVVGGSQTITLGNLPVTVTLVNALSQQVYADTKVTAYRLLDDGKKQWVSGLVTDELGAVIFDLDGIGTGQEFVFTANIFNTGNAYSQVVSTPGNVDFQVGAIPITLLEHASQQVIPYKKISIYEIDQNQKLKWRGRGETSNLGEVVFDVEGLGQGRRFVLKAHNVFGQNKHYYGPVLTSKGQVTFTVKQGEGLSLDLTPPAIDILLPERDIANVAGFKVSGVATDNEGVNFVTLSIRGVEGEVMAQLSTSNASESTWNADIPAQWLVENETIELVATVYDFALNKGQSTKSLLAVTDSALPEIIITSHSENDEVNALGFTIEGEVTDDLGVASISATLSDPTLGDTIVDRNVPFNVATGQWAMAITNGKVTVDQLVTLTFTATDTSGKEKVLPITLNTIQIDQNPLTLVNRITFGLTPDLLVRVKRGDDVLSEQLLETNLDDSALEALLAQRGVESLEALQAQQLYRMAFAEKQLREVMTWFWENHFNTNFRSHENVAFEHEENQQFRQHALGNFADLLLISAKSPAMLHYLNNQQNRVGRPNENYAREVLELHTLGVHGGYTANDIAELAKIFTGWQERNGVFSFNDAEHDFTDKTVMGRAYTGSGVEEGEQALRDLALHPETASYLCSKLVTYFVTDNNDLALQSQCAAEYLAQNGEIVPILRVIFNSHQFAQAQVAREKVKTPVELFTAVVRNFSNGFNAELGHEALNRLGQALFVYPVPTGYSEYAEDWINTNAILQRMQVSNNIVWQQGFGVQIDFKQILAVQGINTADAIVSFVTDIAYGGILSEVELNTFSDILNEGEAFDIDSSEADIKLKRLLASMIASPAYQMQ